MDQSYPFISPFNFPLNLAAHKIAPALAAGCPFILKPASLTPVGALLIGGILAETDLLDGPVAIIDTFSDFDDALAAVNDSRYGIHAGVFNPRIDHAFRAWDELEVGGVLINEIPSWRLDNLPYGGVKEINEVASLLTAPSE
ncbi:MAG: aldehyde dehydrogenase family protein [Burkholderiaceae bacterium]|nr:aldehyde dehydrogenase family protein [Burkholderiaceae bacterium]